MSCGQVVPFQSPSYFTACVGVRSQGQWKAGCLDAAADRAPMLTFDRSLPRPPRGAVLAAQRVNTGRCSPGVEISEKQCWLGGTRRAEACLAELAWQGLYLLSQNLLGKILSQRLLVCGQPRRPSGPNGSGAGDLRRRGWRGRQRVVHWQLQSGRLVSPVRWVPIAEQYRLC